MSSLELSSDDCKNNVIHRLSVYSTEITCTFFLFNVHKPLIHKMGLVQCFKKNETATLIFLNTGGIHIINLTY